MQLAQNRSMVFYMTTNTAYATRTAAKMLASLDHYGNTNPAVSDGTIATPAYYANRLGKILNTAGAKLPGNSSQWWGARYAEYARQILGQGA